MKMLLIRDQCTPGYTLGRLLVNGVLLGYTCEDTDRGLEKVPEAKIKGQTAIPRGTYRVVVSMSNRFGRLMPEVLNVPGFTGIRIHGGNTSADTEGCPLLGEERTHNGIKNCAHINQQLMAMLAAADDADEEVWLEIQ